MVFVGEASLFWLAGLAALIASGAFFFWYASRAGGSGRGAPRSPPGDAGRERP